MVSKAVAELLHTFRADAVEVFNKPCGKCGVWAIKGYCDSSCVLHLNLPFYLINAKLDKYQGLLYN